MKNNYSEDKESFFVRMKSKFYLFFLLALSLILITSVLKVISKVRRVQEKIANKELEVEKVIKEQDELQKKLDYTKSQEFVEKQLRDKLGMAKEGEMVVILPPPEVLRKFAPKYEEEKEVLPDPNWKKWMKLFI